MTFPRPAAACALLLGLLAAVPPCTAASKQLPPYDQRTDAFRRLLFELGFRPLPTFAELQENPSESLFILLGDPGCLSKDYFPEGLRSFVEQGGAVLIATDMKTEGETGEELRRLAGVTVTGDKLHFPLNSFVGLGADLFYAGEPFCPFVQPIAASSPLGDSANVLGALAAVVGAGSRPSLFRNPTPNQQELRVATNAPSQLQRQTSWWGPPWGIHRLAQLPPDCVDEDILFDTLRGRVSRPAPLFAVGGTVGKGRVLVLADHSIFINRMILPRDNSNLEFAANCLHWLRGGVSTPLEALRAVNGPDARSQFIGQRNKVLFWDDGKICTDFGVPLKTSPVPPALLSEPAIVAAVDKTIAKLEDSDYFNRELLERIDDLPGGRERVVRYAVYLLTLAALLFLGYRFLWRTRYRPQLAVPSLARVLREHEPNLSLLDQRRRALLRSGNVWEMGHCLARECFESAGVALTGAAPPRVVMAQGSRWQRWRVNRRVARLWRLAHGDAPASISPAALKHWLRELEELKTALADGTIALESSKNNSG